MEINLYADDGGKPGTKNATVEHVEDEGNVALEFTFLASVDTDEDGMPDAYETAHGLDPEVDDSEGDLDGDGISNFDEFENGTLPEEKDSDGDGLEDPVETGTGTWVSTQDTGTNPSKSDTDGDGLQDGVETNTGSDPLDPSKFISATDTGTDPHNKDTDGDGASDGLEVEGGTNPLDPSTVTSCFIAKGNWKILHVWPDGDPQMNDIAGVNDFFDDIGDVESVEVEHTFVHFHDNANAPLFQDESIPYPLWSDEFGDGSGPGDRNDFAILVEGQINVKDTGLKTFVCNSDDGFELQIDGEVVGEVGNRGRGNTVMEVELTQGLHDVRFIHWERGGGAGVSIYAYRGKDVAPDLNEEDFELLRAFQDLTDTDGDLIVDVEEEACGLDPEDPNDAVLDKDGDGLSNLQETGERNVLRTGCNDPDSDDDGINDGVETGLTALTTAQAVPAPALGDATPSGWAEITVNNDTREVTIAGAYSGMTSAVSAAHLHGLADPGTAVGVLFGLTASGGTAGTITGSGILSEADFAGFLAGRTYVNVHTANNGSGEIRGQVDASPTLTNPKRADTDGDGLSDGVETNTGVFVSKTDTGTDPNKVDTDGDTFGDATEINVCESSPVDANSGCEGGGLLAAWEFDGSAVDCVSDIESDDGGNEYVEGKFGQAMAFDGSAAVHVEDAGFMNLAAGLDQLTISLWHKNQDTPNSSSFWFNSPSSSGGQRGAQAHIPWSNNNVYWDTVGCCAGGAERVNGDPSGQVDDFDWTDEQWHHWVFWKDGEDKKVYLDGEEVLDSTGGKPLPDDFTDGYIGGDGGGNQPPVAHIDDFAVIGGALSVEDIQTLASGDVSVKEFFGGTKVPFQILELNRTGPTTASMTWNSRPNASYTVEFTTDLQEWIEITDGVESEGETTTFEDDTLTENTAEGYYRAREE